MKRYWIIPLASALVSLSGSEGNGPKPPGPYRPAIDPAAFVRVIDNPCFPLQPGTTFIYKSQSESTEVVVTRDTRQILGVTAVVVRDRVSARGSLVEETFDWYAQDKAGNVWYFGEDSREYKNGRLVSTEGSWEAGRDGAMPGIIMKADPHVGETYRQEFLKGKAEDMAKVIALSDSIDVPYGTFRNCLVIEEWSPMESDVIEHKYYARGVGQVLAITVKGGTGRDALVAILKP